jgi:predicted metal-dependent phosphoesterase TrpH
MMNNNLKESMEENLTEKETKLLERVAEALGENIETIYHNWSKNDTIEALVDALEKAW